MHSLHRTQSTLQFSWQDTPVRYAVGQCDTAEGRAAQVLCVHGITRNRHDFHVLQPRLARRFAVSAPDLVGHGDSDWVGEHLTYRSDLFLAQLRHLISARAGQGRVGYVGSSYGGLLGILLAAEPASQVACLVINDAGPGIDPELYQRIARLISYYPTFQSRTAAEQWACAALRQGGPLPEAVADAVVRHAIRPLEGERYALRYDPALPRLYTDAGAKPTDIWHVWEQVSCPVLLLRGQNSEVLTPGMVRRMQSTHPGLDVVEVAGAGHFPHLMTEDQTGIVEAWLAAHLEAVPPHPSTPSLTIETSAP
ncbi:alpha/beta hydrolase [Acidovorax sp. NCPPB 2350]|nr:alpha/beta hydrolase [Acidovorax sp. NCPPB 2350]